MSPELHIKVDVMTAVTLVVTLVWAVSYAVRLFRPDIPVGPAADALATVVVGAWFSNRAIQARQQEDEA